MGLVDGLSLADVELVKSKNGNKQRKVYSEYEYETRRWEKGVEREEVQVHVEERDSRRCSERSNGEREVGFDKRGWISFECFERSHESM